MNSEAGGFKDEGATTVWKKQRHAGKMPTHLQARGTKGEKHPSLERAVRGTVGSGNSQTLK